jgi:hypothetical protein
MKLSIASDIPAELIEIARNCDFSVIPANQQQKKLDELAILASKYIPRKQNINQIKYNEIEVGACPPKLANLINQMDFGKINSFQKKLAMPFIKTYLKQNGIMK